MPRVELAAVTAPVAFVIEVNPVTSHWRRHGHEMRLADIAWVFWSHHWVCFGRKTNDMLILPLLQPVPLKNGQYFTIEAVQHGANYNLYLFGHLIGVDT